MADTDKGQKRQAEADNGTTEEKKLKADTEQASESLLSKVTHFREECAASIADFNFNKKRVKVVSDVKDMPEENEGILYWMMRDQRVQDNWAMLYAQRLALKQEVPLHVCFCLDPSNLLPLRHHSFMLNGLKEVEQELSKLDISFHLLIGETAETIAKFVGEKKIGGLVADFSPLRKPQEWVQDVAKAIPKNIPFCQVDAHNIIPCWVTSEKLEYAARTIRPKVHKQLGSFLTEYPPVTVHPHKATTKHEAVNWDEPMNDQKVDRSITEVDWATPGSTAAFDMLESFVRDRLKVFATERNDPTKEALSNISPWLHFGQIAAQRCVLVVKQFKNKYKDSVDSYTEELVVRRELAENFCFYNEKYDSIEGTNEWAKKTLEVHAGDERKYIYTQEQFEEGKTHEDLWNAAQTQLVQEGKMHGFLRMYWAKKILEWSKSPQEALNIAIHLNDKYSLDGRDPNGYTGCMWSICGIHDQGWAERDVFGKVRYMNYEGCKRKFDVDLFVRRYKAKMN
ncbi:deoxyribodipyrimidine photo-lyase-like [Apostichopus japonicus]|uniref:deoxyribodipyrimidine photo-lyase-like n=1 Tax=Stichopus japonicus TaxID=307972 RepID=UPI003AB2351F